MRRIVLLAALLTLTPTAALADRKAGDACAAALSGDARTIYDAAAPAIRPDSVVKDVIIEKVRPLVMGGRLGRDAARAAAPAAGECLVLVK
mgnify:CR=1 FL=1